MKKTIIILMLLISNFLIFLYFTGKLNRVDQSVIALSREIALLQVTYDKQFQDMNVNLNTIAASISRVQAAGRGQIMSLKNNPAGSAAAFAGKSDAPNTMQQPIMQPVPAATGIPAPASEKTSPVTDDARLSAYFTAGKQAFEKGEYANAKKAFSTLLAMNPPLWEAHLYYIQAAYYENPGKAAADSTVKGLLDTLPAQYNGCSAARFKGLLALEKGTYNEAVTALVRYHSCRKDAESLLALGQGYLALKKPEEADAVFKEILVAFPGAKEAGIAKKYLTSRVNG